MKIIVTVKPVPDTTAAKTIDPATLRLNRSAATVLNPFDEFALEAALRLRDANPGSSVTLLSMAPESAREAIRKGLGMGADGAVLIADAALAGADGRFTAAVLTAAIRKFEADAVICGTIASDTAGAYVPRMLAERLGFAYVANVRQIDLRDGRFIVERNRDAVSETLAAGMPAVITVTKEIGAVRYPSLKGIMAAKNKPLQILNCAEVGIDPAAFATRWQLREITSRPPRACARVITPASPDEAAAAIIAFLHERKAI